MNDMSYGCQMNVQAASIPTSCQIRVTANRVGSTVPAAIQLFDFTAPAVGGAVPGASIPMAFDTFDASFDGVNELRFEVASSAGQLGMEDSPSMYVDNLNYTTFPRF